MALDINGYVLPDGFTTANAGMCQWGFAEKNGHSYFIKEFLSPKYPLDEGKLGPELTRRMRDNADAFFEKKSAFYNRLGQCRTGNNMIILHFFRFGSKYYAVSDRVRGRQLSIEEIAVLPKDQKLTLLLAILYSMASLHRAGIVHSDLRPENILVTATRNGYCTAKLIDFDAGFLEGQMPDQIEGSQNYFSPEAVEHIHGEAVPVTTKSDVWALGLLIHQFWCGRLPDFDEKYHYASEAVLDGSSLTLDPSIPLDILLIVDKMLRRFPEERPTAQEVWQALRNLNSGEKPIVPAPDPVIPNGFVIPPDLD